MTANGHSELLELHAALSLTSNDRIKCNITNHEMVARRETILAHINGKRFKRLAKEWRKPSENERAHANDGKFLVAHKKRKDMLYCKLTGRSIKNETIHVQRHISGKKFNKSLEHWNHCEKTGAKFRPMNLWGSCQPGENDDDDDIELGGGGVDDRERDDLADLHPWKACDEKEEDGDEKMEEETQADYVKAPVEAKSKKEQRRLKRGVKPNEKSIPVRRKMNKMEE